MIQLFVSQPIRNRKPQDVIAERQKILDHVADRLQTPVELIDSYFEGSTEKPLYLLGKTISLMADADVVYFAQGWQESRGCIVEMLCAQNYGKAMMFSDMKERKINK